MDSERKPEEVRKTFFGSKTKTKNLIGELGNSLFKWKRLRRSKIILKIHPEAGESRNLFKLFIPYAIESSREGEPNCSRWRAQLFPAILKRDADPTGPDPTRTRDSGRAPRSALRSATGLDCPFAPRIAPQPHADSVKHRLATYNIRRTLESNPSFAHRIVAQLLEAREAHPSDTDFFAAPYTALL